MWGHSEHAPSARRKFSSNSTLWCSMQNMATCLCNERFLVCSVIHASLRVVFVIPPHRMTHQTDSVFPTRTTGMHFTRLNPLTPLSTQLAHMVATHMSSLGPLRISVALVHHFMPPRTHRKCTWCAMDAYPLLPPHASAHLWCSACAFGQPGRGVAHVR